MTEDSILEIQERTKTKGHPPQVRLFVNLHRGKPAAAPPNRKFEVSGVVAAQTVIDCEAIDIAENVAETLIVYGDVERSQIFQKAVDLSARITPVRCDLAGAETTS